MGELVLLLLLKKKHKTPVLDSAQKAPTARPPVPTLTFCPPATFALRGTQRGISMAAFPSEWTRGAPHRHPTAQLRGVWGKGCGVSQEPKVPAGSRRGTPSRRQRACLPGALLFPRLASAFPPPLPKPSPTGQHTHGEERERGRKAGSSGVDPTPVGGVGPRRSLRLAPARGRPVGDRSPPGLPGKERGAAGALPAGRWRGAAAAAGSSP